MPTPPSSSSPSPRGGRPARPGRPGAPAGGRSSSGGSGRGAGGRTGAGSADSAGRGRPGAAAGGRSAGGRAGGARRQGDGEGPAWKKRAEQRSGDDSKGKQAGWGGVARKGAGRLRDEGSSTGASQAFREAAARESGAPEAWEPEQWIDEGAVRGEATQAIGRGRAVRRAVAPEDDAIEPDPSLRRAVGAAKVERFEERIKDASRAFRRERFEEVRKILRPLAEAAPTAESVRELLGLAYYRLGRWKLAVSELEAFRDLSGSTEQHPVLADCYRALGRHAKVAELWEELRQVSPSAALVAEGRIVYAGSLADQGKLRDAINVLEASKPPARKPQLHHLRVTYALADLHERAGDLPRARQLFAIVAAADPELGDVEARLRALR